MANNRIRRMAKLPFVLLAVVILVFEEFIWKNLLSAMSLLVRLPIFKQIDVWAGSLGKWGSLALFALPVLALFPVKIFALWLLGNQQAFLGATTFVLAKLVGTALFARIYTITEPKIMAFEKLLRARDAFLALRKRLYDWLHEQPFYVRSKALVASFKERLKSTKNHWFKRRLRAAKMAIKNRN